MSSLLAPVQTTFPDLKMRAVVFGSLIRIMHAAKRFGLYSLFLALRAIDLKSSSQPRLKVLTMFCSLGMLGIIFAWCEEGLTKEGMASGWVYYGL